MSEQRCGRGAEIADQGSEGVDRGQFSRSRCEYTFHARPAQSQVQPLTAERAKDVHFWDVGGTPILDGVLDIAGTRTYSR